MKTSFHLTLSIVVVLLLATSQFVVSKSCHLNIFYISELGGPCYSSQIDTTVSGATILHDPFLGGAEGDNCGLSCYDVSRVRYFNGVQLSSTYVLPNGIEGVLIDTFYWVHCGVPSWGIATMTVHIVPEATGIIEKSASSGLRIFPNPFPEKISFAITDNADRLISITIYDLNGRLVEETTNHFDVLSMKREESGLYFYSAITEKGKNYRGKIFKE